MNVRPVLRLNKLLNRAFSDTIKTGPTITKAPPKTDVAGLSSKCVKTKAGQLSKSGASTQGEYKVPEYFCYDKMSYAEAEIEMAKYRCPQPSAI